MKTKVILGTMMALFFLVISWVMPVLSQPLGMISYWKFDEGSGSVASDSVDANDGTIYGASWTAGQVADALSFDGTDDYVLVPDSPNLCPTNAITIEAWIRPEEMDWWWAKMIVIKADSDYWDWNIPASSYELLVRNYPDGYYQVEFGLEFEGGHIGYRTDTGPLTLNEWNHVAGTYDGSFMKIYVNGACVLEQPQSGTIRHSWHPNMTLQIGSFISTKPGYDSVCYFHGSIDEVAIYDRALTAEEINQHYQNGLNGLGYYPTYTLTVHVQKKLKGAPMEDVDITVYNGSTFVASALTDKNGDAFFQLPAGTYTIIAKRHLFGPIYIIKQQTVEIGEDTTITFTFLF